MDYSKLKQNFIDVIKEQQLKLGYRSEVVRLYYPLSSLNRLLGTECDIDGMNRQLEDFARNVFDSFGQIEFSNKNERYCIKFPEKTSDYVHEQISDNEFIAKLISKVSEHGCGIEDIFDLFRSYSDKVCIKKVDNGEFDYLVYFEDGNPDEYRYCLRDEGCHVIYHRYTEDDYRDFGF